MAIQDLFDATFSLYSYEMGTQDAIGGVTRTLTLIQANVAGYITPISGNEVYQYGKQNVYADYRLFTNPMEIETTDIIKIVDDFGTTYYNVLYVDNCNDMPVEHHYEIDLLMIKAPQELVP